MSRSAPESFRSELATSRPKNSTVVGTPSRTRRLGDVGRRLDPQHRHPTRYEILKEIAVVGSQLDHMTALVDTEPAHHLLDIAPAVLEPTARVRREVRVVREDMTGSLELLELNQQAPRADECPQRIERLHPVLLLRGEIAVRQRRHPQVGKRVFKRRGAEAAGGRHQAPSLAKPSMASAGLQTRAELGWKTLPDSEPGHVDRRSGDRAHERRQARDQ